MVPVNVQEEHLSSVFTHMTNIAWLQYISFSHTNQGNSQSKILDFQY